MAKFFVFDIFVHDGTQATVVRENAEFKGSPTIGDVVSLKNVGMYKITGNPIWDEQSDGSFKGSLLVERLR